MEIQNNYLLIPIEMITGRAQNFLTSTNKLDSE